MLSKFPPLLFKKYCHYQTQPSETMRKTLVLYLGTVQTLEVAMDHVFLTMVTHPCGHFSYSDPRPNV